MAHKTLVDGTAYEITGGKALVDGTAYSIKNGKTLVGGTVYELGFEPKIATVILADTSTTSAKGAYITVMGNTYDSSTLSNGDITMELPVGTPILCTVKKENTTNDWCAVILNGTTLFADEGTYTYTVTTTVTIRTDIFYSNSLQSYVIRIFIEES